nr:aminoglycoside phosphotransferase family protein [uncultured Sellimonas sp.]
MKLENVIVERPYKKVYRCEEGIAKVFESSHPKENVFNEALNQARVEATGLNVPKVKSVGQIDGKWTLIVEYKTGKTLEELMKEHPEKLDEYMEQFVDLQLEVHSKTAPLLNKLKDKLSRQINSLKNVVDATTRYELLTRLDSMPNHHKVCHGDFNPSNIIIGDDGKVYIVDWAHATQGNASADAAMTYLMFALRNQELADKYLKLFCKKSDTARQYVQQWLPIVAAAQLIKDDSMEKEFLMKWIDILDYQ